jgi:hypothetical protein
MKSCPRTASTPSSDAILPPTSPCCGLTVPTCGRCHLRQHPVPVGALAIAMGAEDGAPTAALGVVSRSAGPWPPCGVERSRIELDLRLRRSAPWSCYTQQRLGRWLRRESWEGVVAGSASPSTQPKFHVASLLDKLDAVETPENGTGGRSVRRHHLKLLTY